MKKLISLLLCAVFVFSMSAGASALTQPFETGTLGNEKFRIPAIITLSDGSLLAAADMRHDHGSDAPQNLDTLTALSADNGESWEYNIVNHFLDCADGTGDGRSACCNDSALVQSKASGRIFITSSGFPSGCGAFYSAAGTGYVTDEGGELRLALSDKSSSDINDCKYYIGDFVNGFAKVYGTEKNYTVDEELYLYLDGAPLYMKQINSGETVRQHIFFEDADLHVFPTCYLFMRFSDDNGKTWSAPRLLNPEVKEETETFLGICPGSGFVTEVNGKERILFCTYDNSTGCERMSTVYSDDNGETWRRGERMRHEKFLGKSSESQIIAMPNGDLRVFCRNSSQFIGTAVSRDGGVSWSVLKADPALYCTLNCMVSFINTSKTVNGKQLVLGSFACGADSRKNGVIRSGLMDADGKIEWTRTFRLNDDFFAYSCLTELADGRIACLLEDGPQHITLRLFGVDEKGGLIPEDGVVLNGKSDTASPVWQLIKLFFTRLFDFSRFGC